MTRTRRRVWATRAGGALVLAAVSGVALWLMDFGPSPLGWWLLVTLACALAWLVIDTVNAEPASWYPRHGEVGDPAPYESSDQRILRNHEVSSDPGPALRNRLLALAHERDPNLHDERLQALAKIPHGRLKTRDIDDILTRIEDLRDRR